MRFTNSGIWTPCIWTGWSFTLKCHSHLVLSLFSGHMISDQWSTLSQSVRKTISVCVTTGSLFVWAVSAVFLSIAHKSKWNAFTACHALELLRAAWWRCCHRERNKRRVYTWRIVLADFLVRVALMETLDFYLCFLWRVVLLTTVQLIWVICAIFGSITPPCYVNALSTVALKLTTAAASYTKHTPRQKRAIITFHRFMAIMCLRPVKVFLTEV